MQQCNKKVCIRKPGTYSLPDNSEFGAREKRKCKRYKKW
jgi:hypothetical protein